MRCPYASGQFYILFIVEDGEDKYNIVFVLRASREVPVNCEPFQHRLERSNLYPLEVVSGWSCWYDPHVQVGKNNPFPEV